TMGRSHGRGTVANGARHARRLLARSLALWTARRRIAGEPAGTRVVGMGGYRRRRTGGTHGHTWRPDPSDSLPLASAAARYAARDRRAARRVAADRMDVDEKTRHRH